MHNYCYTVGNYNLKFQTLRVYILTFKAWSYIANLYYLRFLRSFTKKGNDAKQNLLSEKSKLPKRRGRNSCLINMPYC